MMGAERADQPTPSASPAPATEFKPVDPGGETTSGATLLIEAYALMWLVVFVFVLMAWRRLKAVDARVADLHAAVRKASAAGRSAGKS